MSMKNRLAKFEKTFKTAKQRAQEEGGFGVEYPDGKYKGRLESCGLNEAQSSGRLQVDMCFVFTAGEYKGEKIHKYQSVETEDDQVWLARDLRRFGIEAPENAEDLEEIVKLLDESKPEVMLQLKTKDSGQFCYINKVLTEIDAGEFAAEEPEEGEESEEFGEKTEEEEEEEVTVEEGMEVEFVTKKGQNLSGKVVEILDESSEVKIETKKGNVFTVSIDSVSIPEAEEEQEEEEEEEKPVKKLSKIKKQSKIRKLKR